jgi:5-methyltetrahydrofolate--homocysteine methyltransferase
MVITMIIIGEKLNGAVPGVKMAIEQRDDRVIRDLAIKQTEAGAHYLDVCAGTAPEVEHEVLRWMIDVVQDAVDTPLCIDSPDVRVIEKVLKIVKHEGIVNSVSDEGEKCDVVFALIRGTGWQVIAQTINKDGIPNGSEERLLITESIIKKAAKHDITPDRIHVDPLVAALSADNQSVLKFIQSTAGIKAAYPAVKITAAISNISFGMPLRRVLNQHFYALAVNAGLDSAVLDPCDSGMMTSILAVEALLGRDRFCRGFTNHYRKTLATDL